MNRIDAKFNQLKENGKKAFIAFITAVDPSLKMTVDLVCAFEKDGVDLIELGVPFSDPLADGPVIQASSMRALEKGINLKMILGAVRQIRRKSQIPILLMGYLNPLFSYGYNAFCKDAASSGVDGLIIPDLPPDDEADLVRAAGAHGLEIVYLLAPTSTPKRAVMIARRSKGFAYYVSLTGVTGSGDSSVASETASMVTTAKNRFKKPVCIGFGISTPRQAEAASKMGDGVIVGSAIVKALASNPKMKPEAFSHKFIRPFAQAIRKS